MKKLVLVLVIAAATVVGNAAQASAKHSVGGKHVVHGTHHTKRKMVYVSFEGKQGMRAVSSVNADELKEIEALKDLAARHNEVNAYHPIQYVVGADEIAQ